MFKRMKARKRAYKLYLLIKQWDKRAEVEINGVVYKVGTYMCFDCLVPIVYVYIGLSPNITLVFKGGIDRDEVTVFHDGAWYEPIVKYLKMQITDRKMLEENERTQKTKENWASLKS